MLLYCFSFLIFTLSNSKIIICKYSLQYMNSSWTLVAQFCYRISRVENYYTIITALNGQLPWHYNCMWFVEYHGNVTVIITENLKVETQAKIYRIWSKCAPKSCNGSEGNMEKRKQRGRIGIWNCHCTFSHLKYFHYSPFNLYNFLKSLI